MATMATAGLLALPARRTTVAGRICPPQRFATKVGRGRLVKAHATKEREEAMQMANSVGLDMSEGIFGFNPFAEKWTGRLAMIGFLTSIVEEFLTGRGTLQQLGFETPSVPLLVAMCILAFGGTAAATAWTLDRARNGRMTGSEIARYRTGLGLTGELQDVATLQARMKEDGDFLSASDRSAIAAAARQPTAADRFLDMSQEREQAEAEARQMKSRPNPVLTLEDASVKEERAAGPSVSVAARSDVIETLGFTAADDMAYAQSVEMSNGRWAMMGFLAAILVEAGTGQGIVGQCITYLKMMGILGPASGMGDRVYYQSFLRQHFIAHSEETDPDHLNRLYEAGLNHARWVVKKYGIQYEPSTHQWHKSINASELASGTASLRPQ